MQNSDYRALFSKHLDELCATYFHPDTLAQQITYWQNLLAPHVAADPYYPLDFGYDLEDFNNAAWEGCCNHVPVGIVPFVEARRASALEQLESYDGSTTDPHWIVQRIDTNAVHLKAHVEGSLSSLQANYSWDGTTYNSGTMSESGMNSYSYSGPLFNTANDKLYYRAILNGTTSCTIVPSSMATARFHARPISIG
jgi:hypothetical protein